jgi:hypothetical protein
MFHGSQNDDQAVDRVRSRSLRTFYDFLHGDHSPAFPQLLVQAQHTVEPASETMLHAALERFVDSDGPDDRT